MKIFLLHRYSLPVLAALLVPAAAGPALIETPAELKQKIKALEALKTHLEFYFFGSNGNEVSSNSNSSCLRHAYGT